MHCPSASSFLVQLFQPCTALLIACAHIHTLPTELLQCFTDNNSWCQDEAAVVITECCSLFGVGESTLSPCYVSSAQPPLPASSAASYFQRHCPCVEVCQQCCSDISQELCIAMESVRTPRSSTVMVCIRRRHPATKSTDINWQAELCFQWTCSVEQFPTSCVMSLSRNTFKQKLKMHLFGNYKHHLVLLWCFFYFDATIRQTYFCQTKTFSVILMTSVMSSLSDFFIVVQHLI